LLFPMFFLWGAWSLHCLFSVYFRPMHGYFQRLFLFMSLALCWRSEPQPPNLFLLLLYGSSISQLLFIQYEYFPGSYCSRQHGCRLCHGGLSVQNRFHCNVQSLKGGVVPSVHFDTPG
jgi:hypothetical protein